MTLRNGPILFLSLLLAASSTSAAAQAKPMPGGSAMQVVVPKSVLGGVAGAPAELQWPQKFELGPGERHAFGFYAGQPGRILVTVQWQGVPLVVSLVKPGGGTVDKTGSGSVMLDYMTTADDLKKGVIWSLRLRAVQDQKPFGAAGTTVHDRPVKIEVRSVATGTVTIQHPPADMQRAHAEFNTQMQKAEALKANLRQQTLAKPPPAAVSASVAAQRQLLLNKGVAARQAAQLEQIKTKIPAEAHQALAQQITLRAQGKTVLAAPQAVAGPAAAIKPLPIIKGATGTTPSNTQAAPSISTLSAIQGDPGTPVLVSGSGFSDVPGEVHFIVANGTDLVAPLTTWTETQILTQVPYKDGVPAYNGYLYVKRADGVKTTLRNFAFYPPLDVVVLGFPIASTSGTYNQDAQLFDSHAPALWFGTMIHSTSFAPWGLKGDDEYYLQTRLKNGWILDSAAIGSDSHVGPYTTGSAGAYITDARIGTDSPYVKVHWWLDAFSYLSYNSLQVTIRGPKGLAYK